MENRLHQGSGKPLVCVVPEGNNTAAIVPCFDEAETIAEVVRGALEHVAAVWVIDDGSSDATGEKARSAGAIVLRNETNRGKGASLRVGFEAACLAGYRWAVTLDGDGQHAASDIPRLLASSADLTIGNRMTDAKAMPWVRRVVNRWMSRRLSRRFGVECPDSQCGFRLLNLDAWARVRLTQDRYEVESEMIAAFAKAGLSIAFVPVESRAARRPSRIHPVVDTVRWFRWWWGQ